MYVCIYVCMNYVYIRLEQYGILKNVLYVRYVYKYDWMDTFKWDRRAIRGNGWRHWMLHATIISIIIVVMKKYLLAFLCTTLGIVFCTRVTPTSLHPLLSQQNLIALHTTYIHTQRNNKKLYVYMMMMLLSSSPLWVRSAAGCAVEPVEKRRHPSRCSHFSMPNKPEIKNLLDGRSWIED